MGLDIYVGTFTRYYSGNWKTIVQQFSEQSGVPVQIVRQNEPVDALTDPSEIQKLSEHWRDNLAIALQQHTTERVYWTESNELPYHTDKPDWDCFGSIILWALYKEQCIQPPVEFDKNWTNSEIFQSSLSEGYKTNFPSLTQDCEIWLPIDIDFTFKYIGPTENEVGISSSLMLLRDLTKLNESTWNASKGEIESWRNEIDPNSNLLEDKAKFGFSILYDLTNFAVENRMPIKHDY
ncbi:hypothetical protein [Phnomibacter sp. MR]|uniref:hypothetical protein n=1 Tax=Phnomibacter sp. MR TaxID=3042318 RepID=UPI003A801BD5